MEISKKFNGMSEDIGKSITYNYVVSDVPYSPEGDDSELREFLKVAIPPYENNIKLSNTRVSEQLSNTVWVVVAEYKAENDNFPNQSSMTFDTSGQTTHKTYDLLLLDNGVNQNGNFIQGADFLKEGMPIGFNGEDVEGVDIVIPSFTLSEVHPIPDSVMTKEYRRKLLELTGTVNNAPFRDFEAGEVLFTGASSSKNGTERWLITFNFEVSLNKRNFKVGGYTIVLKRGWEHVDVRYKKQLSDDNTRIITTPLQVDVHKVYETTDFAELGIGTGTWEEITEANPGDLEQLVLPVGV